jgi:hypothetical protein
LEVVSLIPILVFSIVLLVFPGRDADFLDMIILFQNSLILCTVEISNGFGHKVVITSFFLLSGFNDCFQENEYVWLFSVSFGTVCKALVEIILLKYGTSKRL